MLPDEITYNKQGTCTDLRVNLRNLQNTDLFEGTQEEMFCLEDVPGLPTDPDD